MSRNVVLLAFSKVGMQVTPETVNQVKAALSDPAVAERWPPQALSDAEALLAEMAAITASAPAQQASPEVTTTTNWQQAIAQPASVAARGALHDKVTAAHRPGGKIMRRPRWSADEEPLGGWDDVMRFEGETLDEDAETLACKQLSRIAKHHGWKAKEALWHVFNGLLRQTPPCDIARLLWRIDQDAAEESGAKMFDEKPPADNNPLVAAQKEYAATVKAVAEIMGEGPKTTEEVEEILRKRSMN